MDIQWHPGFYAAVEPELAEDRETLEFQREYNLSRKPMQIDLLVIKKPGTAHIRNEIGRIFRQYNVIEYKSPGDGLSIDDFFKTIGYACIYKGLGETTDRIPIGQVTVSLFRENYPRELFHGLEECNFRIKKECSGIYYVEGLFIPVQIVVTKELEGCEHRGLRILSKNALAADIRGFIEDSSKYTRQGDRENVDAVLQVSVSANNELYNEIRRRSSDMCEALRLLMQDEIEAELQKGLKQGIEQGIEQGMKQGMEQGMKQGIEQGMKQGMKQGMEQGIEKGRQQQARETAYELYDMGLSVDKIAKAIKASIETVQEWFAEQVALM